ncbi:MAG TPA: GxxExxY protein [Lacipirellulaceae bacterium]|jgi:GxxExxY protein|nr:GxxExxY protein [Lacipirellulaceae bacterium]
MLEDQGYKLTGAAFEVYNELGYGMAEEIYQQSLEIELSQRGIPFQTKRELNVYYKDQPLTTRYRPDLVVFDEIVLKLKAVSDLVPEHESQLFNYMRIARCPVGYLLNFGKRGQLEWKRFILSDLHQKRTDPTINPSSLSLY